MSLRCFWLTLLSAHFALSASAQQIDVGVFVKVDENLAQQYADAASAGGKLTTHVFANMEDALKSDADVLLLSVPRIARRDAVDQDIVKALKSKKVIAVGYGAARFFAELGLEIHGGACAHFGHNLEINLTDNRLLTDPMLKKPFQAYSDPQAADNFGMYLPSQSQQTLFVDAIARMSTQQNYAPIVSQNNFIMVGITGSPKTWSKEYRDLFEQMVVEFRKRKRLPFAVADYPALAPGKHPINLAVGRSADGLSRKTCYFRFRKPTTFTATLYHKDSTAVMMLFMGEKNRLHWTREDAKNGEPLSVQIEITADDIEKIGDKYWTLEITNFDRGNSASGTLEVNYELGALRKQAN